MFLSEFEFMCVYLRVVVCVCVRGGGMGMCVCLCVCLCVCCEHGCECVQVCTGVWVVVLFVYNSQYGFYLGHKVN